MSRTRIPMIAAAAAFLIPTPDARSTPTSGPDTEVRVLEEITIEGEVEAPRVLFISGRDQWRDLDFEHEHYRRSSGDILDFIAPPIGLGISIFLPIVEGLSTVETSTNPSDIDGGDVIDDIPVPVPTPSPESETDR